MNISYGDVKGILKQNHPQIWRMDGDKLSTPQNWGDVCLATSKLTMLKEKLKDNIYKNFNFAIDGAMTERELTARLDSLFESLSKGQIMTDDPDPDQLLSKANKNTLQKKLQSWCNQSNINMPYVKSHPGIKVFYNKLKGVPCVIATGGPSLKNAIGKLDALRDKACIMTVGPSFRPCVKRNIYPHFVNAHDANGPNPGGGGGPRFFKDADASQTIGLFINYIYPGTIDAFKGRIAFYYVQDEGIKTYTTMALSHDGKDRPDGSFMESRVIGGSSVAHTALYIAIAMGCNPITFVGLDLSYPDLSNSHFESDNAKNVKNQPLMNVRGINGKMLKTNIAFYSYKIVFDRMASVMPYMYPGLKLYQSSQNDDGSMAGIVHAGLEPMPFDTWIKEYAQAERPELQHILELYDNYVKEERWLTKEVLVNG